MRHLVRHCISRQSSGDRDDARTGQSLPHRRSSDVADTVWLNRQEAFTRASVWQSIAALTEPSAWLRPLFAADQTGNACSQVAAKRRHKMARPHTLSERPSPVAPPRTGFLVVHNMPAGLIFSPCGGDMMHYAFVSRLLQLCLALKQGKTTTTGPIFGPH